MEKKKLQGWKKRVYYQSLEIFLKEVAQAIPTHVVLF